MTHTADLESKAPALVEQARAIAVTTHEQATLAAAFRKDVVKAFLREIDATFDPVVSAALAAHRAAVAAKKKVREPVEAADAEISRRILDFDARERAAREKEEQRIREENARREREAREAREKAERERREVEERARKAALKAAEDARLADAAAAEAAGDSAGAEALLVAPLAVPEVRIEAPPPAPPPVYVPPPPPPKRVEGATFSENWSAKVVDLAALAGYCAANPVVATVYLAPLMPALNALARGRREEGAILLPGVVAVCERRLSSR